MEYTTNLNLKKPDINEYYNIVEQENENADIIDEAIGKLNSDVGTEELTTEAQDCKGAINELNKKTNCGVASFSTETNASKWYYTTVNVGFDATAMVVNMCFVDSTQPSKPIQIRKEGVGVFGVYVHNEPLYAGASFYWIAVK